MVRETFAGLVHADLNLANILLSYVPGEKVPSNLWLIDFARLYRMPVLTDFAKIENDLSYIVLPVRDASEMAWAKEVNRLRIESPTLEIANIEALASTPEQKRYVRLLRKVREIAVRMDPRGRETMDEYRLSLLRYSAHTLGFGEPNGLQRRLALLDSARLAALIMESNERGAYL